jgi:hypothetical protein
MKCMIADISTMCNNVYVYFLKVEFRLSLLAADRFIVLHELFNKIISIAVM